MLLFLWESLNGYKIMNTLIHKLNDYSKQENFTYKFEKYNSLLFAEILMNGKLYYIPIKENQKWNVVKTLIDTIEDYKTCQICMVEGHLNHYGCEGCVESICLKCLFDIMGHNEGEYKCPYCRTINYEGTSNPEEFSMVIDKLIEHHILKYGWKSYSHMFKK
jgi:hypothetical protein